MRQIVARDLAAQRFPETELHFRGSACCGHAANEALQFVATQLGEPTTLSGFRFTLLSLVEESLIVPPHGPFARVNLRFHWSKIKAQTNLYEVYLPKPVFERPTQRSIGMQRRLHCCPDHGRGFCRRWIGCR